MEKQRRSTAAPILIVLAITLIPVMYVLSMGPAYASEYVSPGTYNYVYWPIHWLANGTPLGDLLRAYVHWWKGD